MVNLLRLIMGTVLRTWSSYMSEGQYLATGVLCSLVSFAFVALRFISRHVQRAAITLDDWLIVPALVFQPRCRRNNLLTGSLGVSDRDGNMQYYRWETLSVESTHAHAAQGLLPPDCQLPQQQQM